MLHPPQPPGRGTGGLADAAHGARRRAWARPAAAWASPDVHPQKNYKPHGAAQQEEAMVEFEQTERHYCRNPRCRMRLPAPVVNEREAFCTRGCYRAFYRTRCLICEEAMERRTERQQVCGKRRCRSALEAGRGMGRLYTSFAGSRAQGRPYFIEPRRAPEGGRPFTIEDALRNRRGIVGPRRVIAVEVGGKIRPAPGVEA